MQLGFGRGVMVLTLYSPRSAARLIELTKRLGFATAIPQRCITSGWKKLTHECSKRFDSAFAKGVSRLSVGGRLKSTAIFPQLRASFAIVCMERNICNVRWVLMSRSVLTQILLVTLRVCLQF